ncbi:MAG: hypothetical protein L6R40_000902 [Gallowayella cf. fulva]|nr:MAG: hypothetical protein L6R40_000902 [Xanthomendoza cf. fulva]
MVVNRLQNPSLDLEAFEAMHLQRLPKSQTEVAIPTMDLLQTATVVGLIDITDLIMAHLPIAPDMAEHLSSLSKQVRTDLKHSKFLRINPDPNSGLLKDHGADFIPLQPSEGRKRRRHDDPAIRTSYRSLRNGVDNVLGDESDSTSTADAEFEYSTDESHSDEVGARKSALDEALHQKKVALSNRTKQHPTDWQAWVALVELQDQLDGFQDIASRRNRTNSELRSNADVCLSIYSKALRSVVAPEGRERLHLGMITKATAVWENRKMWSQWQSIIKEHPLSLQVWKKYLDFHHVAFPGSTLNETKDRFTDCLDLLRNVRQRVDLGKTGQSKAYRVQIFVLLRLTLLLREGGFTEVAVAIWQALMEFEFNMPPDLRRPDMKTGNSAAYEESVSAFEHFWDSETPRIGEPNAKGWLNLDPDMTEPRQAEEAPSQDDSNISESWVTLERRASRFSKTPRRTTDEPSDDPYKVVLFSDVRCALIMSPTPSDNYAVVKAFLCFCLLPPWASGSKDETEGWYNDQFARNEILYETPSAASMVGREDSGMEADDHSVIDNAAAYSHGTSLPNAFQLHMGEYERSSDTLFATSSRWFSVFGSWNEKTVPSPSGFVLRILDALVLQDVGGAALAEYLLAFRLHVSPTTARKSAKSLLKKCPTNLRLYNAYALLEHRLGNTEAAYKVWDTAIQMSAKFDDAAGRDAILLWRSRVWQHLSSGQDWEAMQYISRYGSENAMEGPLDGEHQVSNTATATARLRLRSVRILFFALFSSYRLTAWQALSAGRDHMLTLGYYNHAVLYSELLVLSDYLFGSAFIQAAQTSFYTNLELLNQTPPSARSAHESYRQSFARLLFTHVTHKRTYSPAIIRSFLAESITAFPHNTIFLSLYSWNESRFRIDDRVRGIMRDVVFSNHPNKQQQDDELPDHVPSHFFAVRTDMQRGLVQGSNQSAVRGTFERALASQGAAHSAGLWKLYFLYEHVNGGLKRTREVFYRAIGACPWAKEIYMLAFDYLSDGMSEAELRGVYDLMVVKELRIHVAL